MRVYHTTTADAAAAILRAGFNGLTAFFGRYALGGEAIPFTGVWVADQPVGIGEGAAGDPTEGDPVLVIELDEPAIADFELIDEGKPYREWCIPAQLATAYLLGVISLPEADAEGSAAWWETAEPSRPHSLDSPDLTATEQG
ncbi:MAG TPA: hypothetical protein VGS80_21545 [Ktedonobacterales bacterium]|jgi:hypothetical protein|nr:hypothetical protein [Ktedonobacterales bacterium]